MKSQSKFIAIILIAMIGVSLNLTAQKSNKDYIETMIKEIKLKKSGMLGYASASINHIYDITIPSNAQIKDSEINTIINPVDITITVTNGYYNIFKAKISYKVTLFKEFKGSYAMFMKGEMTNIWSVTNETSDFTKTLKALKNLYSNEFEEVYGPEDDFPAEWKK